MLINNVNIITGDGKTHIKNGSLYLSGKYIRAIFSKPVSVDELKDTQIIDGTGLTVIPGIINPHAHRVTFSSPAGAYGGKPLPKEKVVEKLKEHLLQGTTTILSVDGFGSKEDLEEISRDINFINIKNGTIHTPLNIEAARKGDGSGLKDRHINLTVEKRLEEGAVAVGELGAGGTLGGGSQDWFFIPNAVKELTGKTIEPRDAKKLKEAVLGRYIRTSDYDSEKLKSVLSEIGLSDDISPAQAKKLIEDSVLPAFDIGMKGLMEGTITAKKFKVPVILHNAAATKKMILECAKEYPIIAGHSNHSSFTVEEAVQFAEELKQLGAIIDVSTLDTFGAQRLVDSPEWLFALLKRKLVDTFSTDYAGGYHDAILLALQKAVESNVIDLVSAIPLATYNVTKAIPLLAPNRGLIAPGKIADLLLVSSKNISKVDTILLGGKVVVNKGKINKNIA